eukprot:3949734-Ditylum_brightwellii.AAC.1
MSPTYLKSVGLLHAEIISKCKKANKYYKYNGAAANTTSDEDIGLAIGGYKLAFFADLIASYLFEMTAEHFTDVIIHGIYRDDGINRITGGAYLQFTTEVWYLLVQHQNHDKDDQPANNPDLCW